MLCLTSPESAAQTTFQQSQVPNLYVFKNSEDEVVRIPFDMAGNQIILELSINGSKPLNFILDSGVRTPVLTQVPEGNIINLLDAESVQVQGLGTDEGHVALHSIGNHFEIGGVENKNQSVFVLSNDLMHFSSRLERDIHGIIGYDLFKSFVVDINYISQVIKLYPAKDYKHKTGRKYQSFPLSFHRFKPYIFVNVDTPAKKNLTVKLLIDTGGADALWLFERSHAALTPPEIFIHDYLGAGLSGDIFGKRSRVENLYIGKFKIKKPTVSYPDSASISYVLKHKERNGSLGAEILKRFRIVIDYPHSKITFRKNSNFSEPYEYNMSGMILDKPFNPLPIYVVSNVQPDSPAFEAGILEGDIIRMINGKNSSEFSLSDIETLLRSRHGRVILLHVDRNGEALKLRMRLQRKI